MGIELKVTEALKKDVGLGIVRLDQDSRNSLELKKGSIVQVIGKSSTGAIVKNIPSKDEGLGIVRMDRIMRSNSQASVGDKVKIRTVPKVEATKIVLTSSKPFPLMSDYGAYLKAKFLGTPIKEGDKIIDLNLGSSGVIVVDQTTPKGIVVITENTDISVE